MPNVGANAIEDPIEAIRKKYQDIMVPIFFPENPTQPDVILLLSSVLRVLGMEDKGWDPHAESRGVIDGLHAILQMKLPKARFQNPELTGWRLGLLFYSHIIEMSAPYEVLANLLRYQLGKGYHPAPFFDLLSEKEKKRAKKFGVTTTQKVRILRNISYALNFRLGELFDDFYHPEFRNAIAHADFILTDEGFRCRGSAFNAFFLPYEEVDRLILNAKLFIGVFFQLEREFRRIWGELANKAIPYDPTYKGIMEILANDEGLLEGFRVHWPNGTDSWYRRSDNGIEMVNVFLDLASARLNLNVGVYPKVADPFSPVVSFGRPPVYTPLASGEPITWKIDT